MSAVKKTLLVDPALVRRAKTSFGAQLETKNGVRPLQEKMFRDQTTKAFETYGRRLSGIEEVFPDNVLRRKR